MANDRGESQFNGLCLKQKNTWVEKHVYLAIRSAGIANIPPLHSGCRGGAKAAVKCIMTKPDRRYMPRGKGHNLSTAIYVKCLPCHDEQRYSVNIGLIGLSVRY